MFNRNTIILNFILDKANHIQQHKINILKNNYPNIYLYLNTYYIDSDSIMENINRIIYNIIQRPTCKYCNGHVKWYYRNKYADHCCTRCSSLDKNVQNKLKQTNLNKYGVKYAAQLETNIFKTNNPLKNENIKNKIKQTNLNKYGVEYAWNNDIQKQTCLKKYGVKNPFQNKEIIKKIKETKSKLYNNPYFNNREKCKQTCLEKYGVENSSQNKEIAKKISLTHLSSDYQYRILQTRIKNNSFSKSKPEDKCFILLKEKYPDVIRQYRSEVYPFNCDFYIPSLDLYIEYNGSHYHHFHPFNENNINDINELNRLNELAEKSNRHKEDKKSQYDNIIYVWSDLDVRKRNIAKENNLNYLEFYTFNDFLDWYNTI